MDSIMPRVTYEVINRMSFEELSLLVQKQWNEYQEIYDGGIIPLDIDERVSRGFKLKTIRTMNHHAINRITELIDSLNIYKQHPYQIN